MYDELARSQRQGPLEWLVVNALIPSLLVTYALQWRVEAEAAPAARPLATMTVCMLPLEHLPPPLPDEFPSLVRMPAAIYPHVMHESRVAGRVVLKALVDTHGRVRQSSIVVLRTTDARFVAPARRALAAAVFRPARLRGARIASWVTLTIQFNPE